MKIHLTAEGRALRTRAKKIPTQLAKRAGWDLGKPRDLATLGKLRDDLAALTSVLTQNQ